MTAKYQLLIWDSIFTKRKVAATFAPVYLGYSSQILVPHWPQKFRQTSRTNKESWDITRNVKLAYGKEIYVMNLISKVWKNQYTAFHWIFHASKLYTHSTRESNESIGSHWHQATRLPQSSRSSRGKNLKSSGREASSPRPVRFRREGRSRGWSRGLTRSSATLIRSCDRLKRASALAVSRAWFVRPPCIMIADERRASRGFARAPAYARARGLVLRHVRGHVSESPERVGLWHVAALWPRDDPLGTPLHRPVLHISSSKRLLRRVDTHRWMYSQYYRCRR